MTTTSTAADGRWPCNACGADMTFDPAAGLLVCRHCGNRRPLPVADEQRQARALHEHDLLAALRGDLPPDAMVDERHARCPGCGAELELGGSIEATICPFCATPVVPDAKPQRAIRPQAVLPFAVAERDARQAMVNWLGRLWFAPSGLQEYARKGRQLTGIYVPFWTFDADTASQYRGQRGDAYYETRTVRVEVNGRMETRQEQVRKIRWTPVAGRVARFFDDVLVIGATSLPRGYTEALAPWDLGALQPHAADFLSGFQAEAYTVPLDEGHQRARAQMEQQIASDVRHDIGGDEQRIDTITTDWGDETFKHVLLPVWTAAYKYSGRSYRFVVNGQTGKVKGERPWSWWKIGATVVVTIAVVAGLFWLHQNYG